MKYLTLFGQLLILAIVALVTFPRRVLSATVRVIARVAAYLHGNQKHYGLRYGYKAGNGAVTAQGFKLEVSVDDGTTYVEVSNITTIPDVAGEASDLDVTNLSSTQKEYIAGLRDTQSASIEGQRVATDAGQNILRDNAGATQPLKFKNTYADGAILTYAATVKKFSVTGGVDAVEMFSASIRASGDEVWTGTGAPT
jgi:hypothetical protein